MPITALPPAPTRADPVNFSARGDALMTALPAFVTEANALAVEVNDNAALAAGAIAAAATATTAATTATNASVLASAAAIDIDAKYLGPKAMAPTLNNQGGSLTSGVMYFNTGNATMYIWSGSAWQPSAGSISGNFSVIRQKIVATASQTLFTLSSSYTVGQGVLAVYKNGARLLLTDDYTETSSTSVTMVDAATVNDEYYFEIGPTSIGTSFAASNVTVTPLGNISSTNVQAALQEIDSAISSSGISQVTTATTATTLTSTPTLLQITSAAVADVNVTLPNATTCPLGGPLHVIYNDSTFNVNIKSADGLFINVLAAGFFAQVFCTSNSSVAGTWVMDKQQRLDTGGSGNVLVVGGGGGGSSGGGGGGGVRAITLANSFPITPGTTTITVGAGGTGQSGGGTLEGGNGGNSAFGATTATGGGGGGKHTTATPSVNGGSGGGGGGSTGTTTGAAGNAGAYNPVEGFGGGGNAGQTASPYPAGGGGGAGAVGGNATGASSSGAGGGGVASTITGSSVIYAGGGGGGVYFTGTGGAGGSGGGGAGDVTGAANGVNGTANRGGGGGGASSTRIGGNGGTGVVILRYQDAYPAPASTTGSPTVTVSGGWRIYQWNSSGSITF